MSSIHSLFSQKSWANNELFNVLATVTAEEHTDTLHSAIRMLNHIYVVDRIFKAHLLGEQHWYERYARGASENQLGESISFRFTDGDAGTMTRGEMLMHVITHGAYHRGNVGQMLKFISVAPPRDLYTKFLHVSEPARRRA
jgi:uncharacterized damage-inducible protein DinB